MIINDQRFIIGHKECTEFPQEVEQLLDDWVAANCAPRKTINHNAPYVGVLKHAFENDVGLYMPRENFARALFRAGYYCNEYGEFNISSKCPAGIPSSHSKFFKKHAHGISPEQVVIATAQGIRYPYLTDLKRDFIGFEIKDFEEELKLYAYVPFITYTADKEGRHLDWMILKRIDGKEEGYYLLQPERSNHPVKVKLLGEKWVSNEEYDASHTKYNNDFFGEVDHDDKHNEYMYLDNKELFNKYNAGTPIHCAWFKIDESSTKIDHSKLDPFVPTISGNGWIIAQSVRDTSKYIVIDSNKDSTERLLECIAIRWLTDREIENATALYDNDYCGEFRSIMDINNPKTKEGMLAGKKCFGWFKIIE